jgi:hypothetical protein
MGLSPREKGIIDRLTYTGRSETLEKRSVLQKELEPNDQRKSPDF